MTPEMVIHGLIALVILCGTVYAHIELKSYIARRRAHDQLFLGFPKEIRNFWACYAWSQLSKEERWSFPENMPQETEVAHMAIIKQDKMGDKVITYRVDNRYGVYELYGSQYQPGGSDRAPWDNGMEYYLKLIDVVDLSEAKMITELALPEFHKDQIERQKERARKTKEDEELLKRCFDEQKELTRIIG